MYGYVDGDDSDYEYDDWAAVLAEEDFDDDENDIYEDNDDGNGNNDDGDGSGGGHAAAEGTGKRAMPQALPRATDNDSQHTDHPNAEAIHISASAPEVAPSYAPTAAREARAEPLAAWFDPEEPDPPCQSSAGASSSRNRSQKARLAATTVSSHTLPKRGSGTV